MTKHVLPLICNKTVSHACFANFFPADMKLLIILNFFRLVAKNNCCRNLHKNTFHAIFCIDKCFGFDKWKLFAFHLNPTTWLLSHGKACKKLRNGFPSRAAHTILGMKWVQRGDDERESKNFKFHSRDFVNSLDIAELCVEFLCRFDEKLKQKVSLRDWN